MTRLLHIDASPRGERSHSRKLTKEFVEAWKQAHPTDIVISRDVGRNPVPHVDEPWIAAAFTPPSKRTQHMWTAIQMSDQLIDEFLAADIYVIGIPMYNFSVPSGFKAYIDQIVRVGRTFVFEPEDKDAPYKGLVHSKKMFIITARGASGYGSGGSFEAYNHQDPYLKTVFGFLGISDITFIHAENDEFGGERLAESIAEARAKITELIAI
ncbi:FMN-dependent NADH-azoreductase [Scytonema tolypothrichoides VB-61278]|nr:FMN-dependent NADH-azoreductase [Scytonema tolypothrichoides VB-61278]